MSKSQIIPLLIFATIWLIYLWFSTKFRKGWTRKCVYVKGGKINVLLFILILFVVLVAIVKATM